MYEDILNSTMHRDYPLPRGSWVMMQHWEHLLFIHYRLPRYVFESYIPPGLELDTYDGDAWLSIIPFRVSKIRLRGLPQIPFLNSFLEVNVRTYVKRNGIKGVYFFSLDANQLLTVVGARAATLPYFHANMTMKKWGDSIYVDSERFGKKDVRLKMQYQPTGEQFHPEKGSLEHWLIERYFLWTYRGRSLFKGGIHHKRWAIRKAEVNMGKQLLTPFLPDNMAGEYSFAHYAASQIAFLWMIRKEG
ncbi:DUF2071 domain-containing protein [Lentibacillus sp.]|jgi:uncharacterized protein YqjF (DUF2071 family)|uniref:YqjF family protein n=1 Tax=Lentibacillus sp. TaxID=1925746 RepID=UPI002B4ACFD6|nr:DUF2071 domain-containing protein [Lentibacillus sp.]HLS08366.1 DUF2071 domain-containing protein [Lentibacillus sp.]